MAERKFVLKAPGSTIRTSMLKGAVSRARDSERPIRERGVVSVMWISYLICLGDIPSRANLLAA